ncbi:MAG: Maf family protein [Ilumatobacteraceae bacterium]
MADLILASGSPRRREMLLSLGIEFTVMPADVDESWAPGEDPVSYVARVAHDKASAVLTRNAGSVVLAADTTVDLDGVILAKPSDNGDAVAMLESLSGRSHEAHTAVVVASGSAIETIVVSTTVRFRTLAPQEIEWYVATGEPLDKAGAYGIQGPAAAFVDWVRGSVSNVVGLPLAETVGLLRDAGVVVAGR